MNHHARILAHYSLAEWDRARWPNFSPAEFACNHCGELYWAPAVFDMAQRVRTLLGKPIRFNSAHRCWLHNAAVGGAPKSEHKKIALDISIIGHDRRALLEACRQAGFTTFGFYSTFLHTDPRPGRRWATKGGRSAWKDLLTF